MRDIQQIVVHCAATRSNQVITAADIDAMHKANGWSGIGYHYFIRRDGQIEFGRPEDKIGAHVLGWNTNSIGVCMAGGLDDTGKIIEGITNVFTPIQIANLKFMLLLLHNKYPQARLYGHRDFPNVPKACPCFDARSWAATEKLPFVNLGSSNVW